MTRLFYVIASLSLLTLPALADAIDGDWCSPDGKRLSIKGPEITTPGRTTMQGNYRRHQFAYTAPASDDHAGGQVFLQLLNEEEMNFYNIKQDGTPDAPVMWKRCQVTS